MTALTRYLLSLIAVVLLFAAVLAPGLSGDFIYDDFPNLALLSSLPAEPEWEQIIILSRNGIAGILGRPLAMFSFLLQADSWPDNAAAFKLVNLLIHLLNGALVMGFLALLGANDARWRLQPLFAGLVLLIWMLHPIQVSGVLYVVQRMNLLSACFVLLGLVGYLWARLRYRQRSRSAYLAAMVLLPGLAAGFGVLAKENAVLLFIYLAVIEFVLQQPAGPPDRRFLLARILAIGLPLTIILLGGLLTLPELLSGYEQKPFTLAQRVLTQFPVLLAYLLAIFLPRPSLFGLFHDDFPVYSSLFAPPVLVALSVLLLMLALALRYVRSWPVPAFALLWFLAGHAMESTIMPLEMYFEHRNYLPLLGVALALGLAGQALWQRRSGTRRMVLAALPAAALVWVTGLTAQQSLTWGNPLAHAYTERANRPGSRAAHANLVQTLANAGEVDTAFRIHRQVFSEGSPSAGDYVRWLEFACLLPDIELPTAAELERIAARADHDYGVIGSLNSLLPAVGDGRCPALGLDAINRLLDGLTDNSAYAVSRPDLLQLRALSAAGSGNYALAADIAGQSYALRRNVSVGLLRMNWLLAAQQWQQAAAALADYQQEFAAEISQRQGLQAQIQRIRSALLAAGVL